MALTITAAGKTDVGLVRSGNEDYLYIDDINQVYVVCDGMGGHQAGEVASMAAVQTIDIAFNKLKADLLADDTLAAGRSLPDSTDLLLRAIRLANREIHNRAEANPSQAGMGTTVVAMAFEHDLAGIAHVGDSRAYRLDEKQLTPLTADHSWVSEMQNTHQMSQEEAESLVGKNVITRALGVRDDVEVDGRLIKVKPGDTFILCSDGLCGFADDDEIFEVAKRHRDKLDKIVDDLVQFANDRGGNDNVTVVAIRIESVDETELPELPVFTLPAEDPDILAAEDQWLERFKEFQTEDPPPTHVGAKKKEHDRSVKSGPASGQSSLLGGSGSSGASGASGASGSSSGSSSDPSSDSASRSGASRAVLAFIFIVFAIIAVAIIYFLGMR